MNRFETIENEVKNLNSDVAKTMLAKMLNSEAGRLKSSIVPLNANYEEIRREEKEEHLLEGIACLALAAGAVALGAVLIRKFKVEMEKKATLEKAKLEEDRKDMIRKLAQLKGKR